MKKLLLIFVITLVLTLSFVSCDEFMNDIVGLNEETISATEESVDATSKETAAQTESVEEQTSEMITDAVIGKVDMNIIVEGGKVIKKHDPSLQVYSQTMGDYRIHLGIDIECEMNVRVNSMIDGVVTKIWEDSLMGNCVAISNGTYVVIYKNLASETAKGIEEGSRVSIGQMIGYIGDSAMIEIADPPHLHLEITKDGLSIDPLKYIEIETEDETETETETEETIEAEIAEVDIDSIVAGGKVVKKHNSELQVWSPTTQDYRVHLGIDIECEMNAPVYSMIDGEVAKIWLDSLMGNCVAISNGTYTAIYKNLSNKVADGIAEGNEIFKGQVIGNVGDTALLELAEEPHLHLEMTKGDLMIDPLEYIIE